MTSLFSKKFSFLSRDNKNLIDEEAVVKKNNITNKNKKVNLKKYLYKNERQVNRLIDREANLNLNNTDKYSFSFKNPFCFLDNDEDDKNNNIEINNFNCNLPHNKGGFNTFET